MFRSTLAAVAAALLAAVGVTLTAAPAQAAGSCGITVSSRIVMDTPYKKVPVTYGNDCVANQASASWSVTHVSEGPQDFVFYDHAAQDDRSDYFELYDWQPVGSHTIDAEGAYSTVDYSPLYQNAPATTVKLGARVALQVTRSGGRAYFTTTTSAYSPSRDAFSRYPNAKVAVQYKSCSTCAWATMRVGYTTSSAAWSFNLVSSKKFYFRSVLYSGPRTWDAQGPTLFR